MFGTCTLIGENGGAVDFFLHTIRVFSAQRLHQHSGQVYTHLLNGGGRASYSQIEFVEIVFAAAKEEIYVEEPYKPYLANKTG